MEQDSVNVLGSLDEQGRIVVLRFHKGETIIESNSMSLICGNCGERVFIKEKNVSISNNG